MKSKEQIGKRLWIYFDSNGNVVMITTENIPEDNHDTSEIAFITIFREETWNWRKVRGLDKGKYTQKEG